MKLNKLHFTKPNNYTILLFFIVTLIYWMNYIYGTYLIGWDSLQVELNPLLNIQRNFFSVWEEYQGLGLVAGNAHAVEALRSFFILLLTIILPDSLVRYVYHYICILLGVLFIFRFQNKLGISKKASFVGALVYFLNIGTIQNFYVPFEPFSAFYAFLPLALTQFQDALSGKVDYLKLILGLILLTFAFQVPTIFIVYSLVIICAYLCKTILVTFRSRNFKSPLNLTWRMFKYGVIFLSVNAFWFLPFIYFVLTNSSVRFTSLATKLSTPNVVMQNQAYSNFTDLLLMRGFWYSNIDFIESKQTFGYMMHPWIEWIANPWVLFTGYLFAGFVIIGLIYAVYRKAAHLYVTLPILFLSLYFLFGYSGPFGGLYQIMVNLIPMFGEAFRFAFTKWIIPLSFVYAVFFAEFVFLIQKFVFKVIRKTSYANYSYKLVRVGIVALIVFYMFPILNRGLFYNGVQPIFPDSYNSLFNKLKSDELQDRRIALLPANNIWGWSFTDWGYRGSGFLWYGIEQPILSRTFDVWNNTNEQFYREFQYAIYSKNNSELKAVLEKYDVSLILLDKTVYVPDAPNAAFTEEIQKLLSDQESFQILYADNSTVLYGFDKSSTRFIKTPEKDETLQAGKIIKPFSEISNYADFVENGSLSIDLTNLGKINLPDTSLSGFPYSVNLSNNNVRFSVSPYPILDNAGTPILKLNYNAEALLEPSEYKAFIGDVLALESGQTAENVLIDKTSSIILTEKNPYRIFDLGSNVYSAEISGCYGDGLKGYDKYPGSLIVSTKDVSTCLSFTKEIEVEPNSMVQTSFTYQADPGVTLTYCLYDIDKGNCITDKYSNSPVSGYDSKSYLGWNSISVPQKVSIRFSVEGTEGVEKTAYIRDLRVFLYRKLETLSVPDMATIESSTILEGEGTAINLENNDENGWAKEFKPGDKAFSPIPKNCDSFSENYFDRKQLTDESGEYFLYSAKNAISCDDLAETNINPHFSYLITFDSQNVEGKGLDVCIYSTAFQKCLIQDRLEGKGKEFYILPSYPDAGKIGISVRNQSIGNVLTENKLYSVKINYINFDFLNSLTINKESEVDTHNGVVLNQVNKLNPSTYFVSVKKTSDQAGFGLIELDQSFDKGWMIIDSNSCAIAKYITPFMCKNSEIMHVKVQDWANGWLVPAVDSEYIMIFWPQWLQFYGYGICFMAILAILSLTFRGRRNR